MSDLPCKHCGKSYGEHWAPYAFCSIDDDVTPESATRYEPVEVDDAKVQD
jgi:hypothetical protein